MDGEEEIVFDTDPEDEAVTVEQLEAEIQKGLEERQKIIQDFPGLACLDSDQLPDGAGDELRAALTRYEDIQIHGKPLPSLEEDAALAAASFAMRCGVLGDYEELWAVVTGQKSFFE